MRTSLLSSYLAQIFGSTAHASVKKNLVTCTIQNSFPDINFSKAIQQTPGIHTKMLHIDQISKDCSGRIGLSQR